MIARAEMTKSKSRLPRMSKKEAKRERKFEIQGDENRLSIYCHDYLLPDNLLKLQLLAMSYYWILSFTYPWKSSRHFIENAVAIQADGSTMYQLQPLDKDFTRFRLAWIEPPLPPRKPSEPDTNAIESYSEQEMRERGVEPGKRGPEISAAERWLPLRGKFKVGDEITYEQLAEIILTGPHCRNPKIKIPTPIRPVEVFVDHLGGIFYVSKMLLKKMRIIRDRIVKRYPHLKLMPYAEIDKFCVRNARFVALRNAYNILTEAGRKDPAYQKWQMKWF